MNVQQENELKRLKADLLEMKKQRVKMLNQMRTEATTKKLEDQRKSKEIAQLKKDSQKKECRIKSLEADAKRREFLLKRRQEDLVHVALRKNKLRTIASAGSLLMESGAMFDSDEVTSVDEDLDSVNANIEYVQQNILELQNELIAVEDARTGEGDTVEAHSIIMSCNPRECKYIMEHLLDLVLHLGVTAQQKVADVKALEARLKALEHSVEVITSLSTPQLQPCSCSEDGKHSDSSSEVSSAVQSRPRSSSHGRNLQESRRSGSGRLLTCVHTASGHTAAVTSVYADQNLLFSASQDRTVKAWDLKTSTELLTLEKHLSYVRSIKYCPHTRLIFTASQNIIKIWDMRNHKAQCVRKPLGSSDAVQDLLVFGDGGSLFSASGNIVNIWDLQKMVHVGKLTGHNAGLSSLAVLNNLLITGSRDRLIKLYGRDAVQFDVVPTAGVVVVTYPPQHTLQPPHYDAVTSFVRHEVTELEAGCGWGPPSRELDVREALSSSGTLSPALILVKCKHTKDLSIQLQQMTVSSSQDQVKRGSAALHGEQCYVAASDSRNVYAYRVKDGSWTEVSNYPYTDFQLAVVGGYLTGVGGRMRDEVQSPSNELYSLIDGEWKPHFPAMATSRVEAAVVSCGKWLVVIGGVCDTAVEILDSSATPKWTHSCPLPERLEFPSAACCGDEVYVVEGDGHTVYTASVISLAGWTPEAGNVWRSVDPAPRRWSTATSVCGQLVALGGWKEDEEPTSDVHVYVAGGEWRKIGELVEPRDLVIVAPLADGSVLVVGGSRSTSEDSCVVEILSVA
ncbi:hypothetical protein EMCRGX_G017137 [Ephydatia muelleri]